MNLSQYEGIKVADMMHVLRKLGYRQVRTSGIKMRFFAKDGGESLPLPYDPEEEMFPKMVWWTLNLIRLPDEEFARLRRGA